MNLRLALCSSVALLSVACAKSGGQGGARNFGRGDTLTIAMIAKSSTNPVFLASRTGAEAAADSITRATGVIVKISWLTPPQEDGQVQAQRIQQAVNEGADAVLISCSDAAKVIGVISDAVDRGVPVMTFDSDAPLSRRFAFYGVDDRATGQQVMSELAKLMNGHGKVAILAGNQNAPNLQNRVAGVREEAAKYPGITVVGVFNHIETPQDAAAEVIRANNAYPDITGWAMIGGWPLFTQTLLTDLNPNRMKVVSVDALPVELAYVDRGVVPVLLAQSVYLWGYVGVTTIVNKLVNHEAVSSVPPMQLVRVSKESLGAWARQLKAWGFTDVDSAYVALAVTGGAAPAVRFDGIVKRFPGVQALGGVTLEVAPGSVHALCGENGAGKSTLGKLLAGIYQPDEGTIHVHGQEVRFASPRDALAAGVGMVHQEGAACEQLSVAENLCLGTLASRRGLVDWDATARRAGTMLAEIGADLDVRRPLGALPMAQQQLVQIAAAVGGGARVIVFDEPTSSLGHAEVERLFALIGRLKARGVTCLYVSHRMPEVFRLCDTVSVLRDGLHVATRPIAGITERELTHMMIGRPLSEYLPPVTSAGPGEELLRVEGLTQPGVFEDVSFALHAGEVVGLAGLVGAGRSELAQALFGIQPAAKGTVRVRGRPVTIGSPRDAIVLGLGLVPEDRKRQAVVPSESAEHNVSLPILRRLASLTFLRRREERALADEYCRRLQVRAPDLDAPLAGLSGGNQQKVVIARWLAARSSILILDEPTRGVDVGAKAEIHALIGQLAAAGNAVLLISSELPELLSLSMRILVLRAGRVVGEVARRDATQAGLLGLMAGFEPGERDAA